MVNVKISELAELASVADDDELVIVDTSTGSTKKIQKSNLVSGSGGDVVGPASNHDDYLPQWDGVDSNILKDGIPTSTFAAATHATTHQSGGADAIKLDDLAVPDDNTDLDFSTSKHGLVPKGPNTGTKFLRDDATWDTPAGGGDVVGPAGAVDERIARFNGVTGKLLEDSGKTIADFADATHASRHKSGGADAVKLDELAAPTDVTTLNATTSAHGLLKKLDNNSDHFINGQGNWATPSGGGSIDLTSLSEITSLDEDDLLLVYDDSASANKKFKATPVVYARAYTSEPYIPYNSATIVNFANVALDTHSAITTGASWKFTAPKSGYYTISATVLFKDEHTTGRTPGDEGIIILDLYVNGTLTIEFPWTHVDSAMSEWLRPGVSGSFTLYLAASSYVQMKVTQAFMYNGGSGTDLVTSHISILGR